MLEITKEFIETTNTQEAALLQLVLENNSVAYKVEYTTLHLNYSYFPDSMSQEQIKEARRIRKEQDRLMREELNKWSDEEIQKLHRDESTWIIDEEEAMDVWAARFTIKEEDIRFLTTLPSQVENMKERVEDQQDVDVELVKRYETAMAYFDEKAKYFEHPYEDLNNHYPFLDKTSSDPK